MSRSAPGSPRILLLTPHAAKGGGIANYFEVARPHFQSNIDYVLRGRREPGRGPGALRLVMDYLTFARQLISGGHRMILQNTSLGVRGVPRDAVFLLIAKLLGRKVVVFFHGWDPSFAEQLTGWKLSLFRWVYFRSDGTIVLASEFEQRLRRWGYRGPVHLGSTIVDEGLLSRALEKEAASSRREFVVLFLGRLEPAKGVLEAIRAVASLQARGLPVRLLVAGSGTAAEAARALASRLGADVEFLGHVKGADRLLAYTRADVYLLPSYYPEGMPTSVLEAMAAGLPVVTRPVGGLRDFFRDGEMGFLTESLDPAEFAMLLERLLRDPELRERMGRFNAKYASEHFRATAVVGRLEGIFRTTLAEA